MTIDIIELRMRLDNFELAYNDLAKAIHEVAVSKGWWECKSRNEGEIIALIHSELSEALEGLRHGNPPDQHVPEFNSVSIELADVIIRIMDYAHAFKYPVAAALSRKMMFNLLREFKHGGKSF